MREEMSRNNFTVDDLKDIVAGALNTVLSRANETGSRGLNPADDRPRGSRHVTEDEEVAPLPPPLHLETRRRRSMPSTFLERRTKVKKSKQERIYSYERDIVCLPSYYKSKMCGNCLPIPRGNKCRQYLAKHGLLGKITLTSDMTENEIFEEVSSVFTDSFGGRADFKFQILQPTGGFSKSLTVPKISSQYRWSASSVAGKNAKVPIYILAQEPLKFEEEEHKEEEEIDEKDVESPPWVNDFSNFEHYYEGDAPVERDQLRTEQQSFENQQRREQQQRGEEQERKEEQQRREEQVRREEQERREQQQRRKDQESREQQQRRGEQDRGDQQQRREEQDRGDQQQRREEQDRGYQQQWREEQDRGDQLQRREQQEDNLMGDYWFSDDDEQLVSYVKYSTSPVPPTYSPITPPRQIQQSCSSNPTLPTVQECIEHLRQESKLHVPTDDDDWSAQLRTDIVVRRMHLIKDAVKEAKKTRFDPSKLICVKFVGEAGVDTGGPSREFWHLLSKEIACMYCRGQSGKLVFERNTQALQNMEFKVLGIYTSMSIIQGGPGCPYFLPALYKYMTTGDYLQSYVDDNDIPDAGVRHLVAQLRIAADEKDIKSIFADDTMTSFLAETGYKKPPSVSDKFEMCSTLKQYHTLTKVKAELDQFMEGLQSMGVLRMTREHSDKMKVFFVANDSIKLQREYFSTFLEAHFSPVRSPFRAAEEQSYIFFWDFLDECEAGSILVGGKKIELGDVLNFFTGAFVQPVLGFGKKGDLQFLHGKENLFATSSTCDLILRLPTCHDDYRVFVEKMIESICNNDGFGHV